MDKHGLSRQFALMALCLAGDPTLVSDLASKTRDYDRLERFAQGECPDFLADPSPESELRLLDAGSGHAYALIGAHLTIAMSRIADGDRPGAIQHLQKSTHTQNMVVGNLGFEIARAILDRMERDDQWPRWLAEKARE